MLSLYAVTSNLGYLVFYDWQIRLYYINLEGERKYQIAKCQI